MDLGDALAEHVQREFRVITDEDLTAYLTELGTRLAPHLPPTDVTYRFFLSDLPFANAFTLPGGRIYVSRKLIAFMRSEDELAGVLAHEMAHVVSRRAAINMTRIFKALLGTDQVSDRADVFAKYHRVFENIARDPKALRMSRKEEQKEQELADLTALYAVAGAGYPPEALANVWDRFAQTEGKTGNWLTDLFGATRPGGRRLRELLDNVQTLPPHCREARAQSSHEKFADWQAAVTGYSGLGRSESLHNVVLRKTLNPPIRNELNHLRFSPDGRHILAQDDTSIFVLIREPLEVRFRIDAPEAYPAQFTSESQSVVVYNRALRVETWSISNGERSGVHELVLPLKNCLKTALAPDGKTVACFDSDFHINLVDVNSNQTLVEESLQGPTMAETLQIVLALLLGQPVDWEAVDWVHFGFSPDTRYFVAARNDSVFAYDLSTRAPLKLPGRIKKYLRGGFTFLTPSRLVGVNIQEPKESAVVDFPSGEVVTQVTLGRQRLSAPARGDYVLMRPIQDYALGVLDLKTDKIVTAHKTPAFDVYDEIQVAERRNGEVGLYRRDQQQPLVRLQLPRSPLGRLQAAAVSPDLGWLAVSDSHRGGVWKLVTGSRVFYTQAFGGAYFGMDGFVYADFPKHDKENHAIGRLQLGTGKVFRGAQIDDQGTLTRQYGRFNTILRPGEQGGSLWRNALLRVWDIIPPTKLVWSRSFPKEAPKLYSGSRHETLILAWPVSTSAAKEAVKENRSLQARLQTLKEKEGDYYLEVLETATGQRLGQLLVETGKGSFRISDVSAAGDWVSIADNQNRVLVYSLSAGELKGRVFGQRAEVAATVGLLCVENERGSLALYDLKSFEKRAQLDFADALSFFQFSPSGRQLFVLTANQTAYLLDVSLASQLDGTQ
ncbi:MAG: M48 family metalloprotease [Candidatus Acidiferrales bacterium]